MLTAHETKQEGTSEPQAHSIMKVNGYTPTIGLEIHAELKTVTKMFCACTNDPHEGEPNTYICPVCMGHPGTLPAVNKEAVRHVLTVGAALGAELATYTEFDRKNYFYPDIPKGYQISQYAYPLVKGGSLYGIAITRVHLEEDTARSQHREDSSIIDYNRAGVPLMELVTEPVIHDAKTAGNFARELQLLLKTLQVSGANMERGEMRVEANISVSKDSTFGTKVEVKNINSFKAVEQAILYEVKRQIELLDRGEQVVQETRGWDENRAKTFSQRKKETSHDYRYFPDPDIPKCDVAESELMPKSRLDDIVALLPNKKRSEYKDLGLSREQTEIIISDISIDSFFKQVINILSGDKDRIKIAANYLTTDLLALLGESHSLTGASPSSFASLIELIHTGTITSRAAKDMLPEVVFSHGDPRDYAAEHGLLMNNSREALTAVVKQVIHDNEAVVREYRAGKTTAIQYLIGQAMKVTKGSADPQVLRELFTELLS